MALTGFLANGVCHSTSASALTALQASYPWLDNKMLFYVNTATFTAPNTFSLSVGSIRLDAVTTVLPAVKTFTLPMCDPAISIYGLTPFDPVVAAAFWMWALTMVLGCWLVAHNAGTIVNFINRIRG